jgi:predicted cupin superfamily sugar epimerase
VTPGEAEQVIAARRHAPQPQGGWFRETFRDAPSAGGRGASTAIYYLLRAGEVSRWHRIDAVEIWHWYAGAPLLLSLSPDGHRHEVLRLGGSVTAGERPQAVVPIRAWQSARSQGAWTLVGCTVAPAFQFAGFELAAAGWEPG